MRKILALLCCIFFSAPSFGQSCITSDALVTTPPPSGGTYPPGTTVQFCYTVNTWTMLGANWLHSIVPIFGAGWDASTLQPVGTPTNLSGSGVWLWTNNVTSTATGLFIPDFGWYYDNPVGGPGVLDGNPGNNWGDNANGPWTFCWQITTMGPSSCLQGADLQVQITSYADGEAGSWGTFNCQNTPDYIFPATLSCCGALSISSTDPKCNGDANGSAIATGSGLSPYDYSWETSGGATLQTVLNSANPDTLSGLLAGSYSVTIADDTGCTTVQNFILTDPAVFQIGIIIRANSSCANPNAGWLDLLYLGGVPPLSFLWSNGDTTEDGLNLAAGNYTVSVTDANGCVMIDSSMITGGSPSGPVGVWTWLGAVNVNWFEPCNWDKFSIPDSTSNVLVPGSAGTNPLISMQPAHCRTIQIEYTNGAQLYINEGNGGELIIAQ